MSDAAFTIETKYLIGGGVLTIAFLVYLITCRKSAVQAFQVIFFALIGIGAAVLVIPVFLAIHGYRGFQISKTMIINLTMLLIVVEALLYMGDYHDQMVLPLPIYGVLLLGMLFAHSQLDYEMWKSQRDKERGAS